MEFGGAQQDTLEAAKSLAKKKSGEAVMVIVLGVIIAIAGLAMIIGSLTTKPKEVVDFADAVGTDLDKDLVYRVEKLFVIDQFAALSGKDSGIYVLAGANDRNGDLCAAGLFVKSGTKHYDEIKDYLEDDDQMIGSLSLNGYITVSSPPLADEYKEGYNESMEIYGQRLTMKDTGKAFKWLCDEDKDPAQAQKSGSVGTIVIGVCTLLFAGMTIWRGVSAKKKIKKIMEGVE